MPNQSTLGYNTYVGARYVPIIDGEWNATKQYEPLVVVTYQGNSYTSRSYVPAGVVPTNETYWALTGNYNAQIEVYRQEVADVSSKINNSIQYVTPEMFGAVGDGIHDDTNAVQAAFNSGKNVKASNKYKISSTIYIRCEGVNHVLDGQFNYNGTGYAFNLNHCEFGGNIVFGVVISSGSCLNLSAGTDPTDEQDYLQYLNLTFDRLSANANTGIAIELTCGSKWVNENKITGGRILNALYAVRAVREIRGQYPIDIQHNSFYHVGFETTLNGALLKNADGFSFINCRIDENANFITTEGVCTNLIIISGQNIFTSKLNLSSQTYGSINAAVLDSEFDYTNNSYYATINDGKIFRENQNAYKGWGAPPAGVTEIDLTTGYDARNMPTSFNIHLNYTSLKLNSYYGVNGGINTIFINANEYSQRQGPFTVYNAAGNVIATIQYIPDYTWVKLDWMPNIGWTVSYPGWIRIYSLKNSVNFYSIGKQYVSISDIQDMGNNTYRRFEIGSGMGNEYLLTMTKSDADPYHFEYIKKIFERENEYTFGRMLSAYSFENKCFIEFDTQSFTVNITENDNQNNSEITTVTAEQFEAAKAGTQITIG